MKRRAHVHQSRAILPALAMLNAVALLLPAHAQDQAGTSTAAIAAGGLEEVMVTARRTQEPAQRTPLAVTTLGAADLERRQISELQEVQYSVPNMSIGTYPGDPSSVSIQLRGQVQSDLVATNDPTIGVYLDGVYLGRGNGGSLSTVDLERIEVLRGPQGTLFGRNTTGGAINIVSKDPVDAFEGFASARMGRFDLYEVSGALNLPIQETLAARLTFQHSENDGYAHSRYTGRNLLGTDMDAVRLKLRWQPTESVNVMLSGDYSDNSGNGAEFKLIGVTPGAALNLLPAVQPGTANGRSISSYVDGDLYRNDTGLASSYDARIWGTAATVSIQLGEVELKSISGYRKLSREGSFDYDGTPYIVAEANSVALEQDQFSQELQVNGSASDARLTYTTGLLYFTESARDVTRNDYLIGLAPPPVTRAITDGEVENDSYAAYAQASYGLFDNVRITAGLRYTKDERQLINRNRGVRSAVYDGPPIAEVCAVAIVVRDDPASCQATLDADFDYWSYTAGIDYQLSERTMVYFRTGRSYKAGGFNIRSTAVPASFAPFQPEELTDYELGIKADLLDRRLRANVAVFYSDYRDMQRTLQVATPAGPNPSANFTTNAEKAHISGIEAEITAQMGNLRLSAAGGYLRPVYDDYRDQAPPFADRSEEPFIYASEYNFALGARYDMDTALGEFHASTDYSYRTKFVFQPQDTTVQDAYGLLNAQASVELASIPGLEVGAYIKNVTDESYFTTVIELPALGFISVTPGEPRTYGAMATFSF